MNTHIFLLPLILLLSQNNNPQDKQPTPSPWQMQQSGVDASLRGLHVVSDTIVWSSGTSGTVLRTVDGGQNWSSTIVADGEKLDFRDIHAFDADNAVIVNAGSPARIYRTEDAGQSWTLAYEHPSQKAFFDAISFWDDREGIVMSDPVDDRILIIKTTDAGKTWFELKPENRPVAIPGEGGFAASGTNMVLRKDGICLIALGSAKEDERFNDSRIAISSDRGQSWEFATAPLPRNQSSGIFSIAFADKLIGVAVGGDYLNPDQKTSNAALTSDGGKTWKTPSGNFPSGYRSGVAAFRKGEAVIFVTVGSNGTDWTKDNGNDWTKLTDEAFHAIQFSPTGNTGWATGANGRIGKWIAPPP